MGDSSSSLVNLMLLAGGGIALLYAVNSGMLNKLISPSPAAVPSSPAPIFATDGEEDEDGDKDEDEDEEKKGGGGGKRRKRGGDGDRDKDEDDKPTPFDEGELYQGGPLGPQQQQPQGPQYPPGYYPGPNQLPVRQTAQAYPFTGYPTSAQSPQFNPAAPGLLSSLQQQYIPSQPSYTTSPVGTYSPYSPYNQFQQYHQYTTNPTIYHDIKPDDNFTFSDIDVTKMYYDTQTLFIPGTGTTLGGGGTTSCQHCRTICARNPFSAGCHNCRPKCKVTDIRTLNAGGTGWNIGPANVVGSFFTDIYETLTHGFHDSEHYDRDREFDCHNKRIKKPTRRKKQWEDRMNQFVDPEDYQYDRHDVPIALQ